MLLAVEPTSALDAHTEAAIAERLRAARADRTTVVTSTSPLLLDHADSVHYLVDGKVAASGRHRVLLETEAGYRALVARDAEDTEDAGDAEDTDDGVGGDAAARDRVAEDTAGGEAAAGSPSADIADAGAAGKAGPAEALGTGAAGAGPTDAEEAVR
ncbi:ABC transporter OS=Streptomyces aurantiogriseus OX=66870 GN=GCM10010251_36680 PE=4 SV=1 [Streptomyces aurantiogriseus]